jgi:hypothetical protein
VIVIDGVVGPWGHQLRWRAFGVRVPEADVERLPEILAAIPPARVRRMQRAAAAVWRRFAWLSHPAVLRQAHELIAANAAPGANNTTNRSSSSNSDADEEVFRPRPLAHGGWRGDAFHTLLEWLHHKLALRGGGSGSGGGIGIDEGGGDESQDRPPPRHHRRRRRRRGGGGGDAASGGADEPSV